MIYISIQNRTEISYVEGRNINHYTILTFEIFLLYIVFMIIINVLLDSNQFFLFRRQEY
jgi:hypothetical protein